MIFVWALEKEQDMNGKPLLVSSTVPTFDQACLISEVSLQSYSENNNIYFINCDKDSMDCDQKRQSTPLLFMLRKTKDWKSEQSSISEIGVTEKWDYWLKQGALGEKGFLWGTLSLRYGHHV